MNYRTAGPTTIVLFGTILSTACAPDALGPNDFPAKLTQPAGNGNVWIGAGDIAACSRSGDDRTADLVESLLVANPTATVFTAGDNVYDNGTAQEYADCYDPTWGRFKDRTWATIGNHEYNLGNADPTFDYFGERVGPRGLGYYSLDQGNWHIVMLNSNTSHVPADAGSAQEQWLRADLAATTKPCVMAVFHHPRFFSCKASDPDCGSVSHRMKDIWDALYEYGAELIITGHKHHYERFAPQDPDGNPDPVSGIRQIIVGTGGTSVGLPGIFAPNSEVVNDATSQYGVIKLTLHDNSYDWEFVPIPGVTFTDSGSGTCTGA